MAIQKCILCSGETIKCIDSISTKDLAKLYKSRSGIDIHRFITAPVIQLYTCNYCGLLFYLPQAIGDGTFYDELQQYESYYMEDKAEFQEASNWITKKDKVLEIGCGTGHLTDFITYASYTGLEFSEKSIQTAKARGLNVLREDLTTYSMSNPETYDVVCYFQVLEHVKNPGQFIKESLVCLKPGGRLLLAVPSEESFIGKAVNFYLNMPPHHASRYSDHTLRKIADLQHLHLDRIFHEQLDKRHRLFYLKTKLYHQLNACFSVPDKPVDTGFGHLAIYSIATALAVLLVPFFKKKAVMGQSVMAVYTKHKI